MPFDAAALLKHRDFVRAVAGRLLDDPNLVDDVEQETWATALGRPPRSAGALAAWLGQVARRLSFRALRSRDRRSRRERASYPPRPPSTPDELAQALETQQRLVEAVLKLDRLYREVILLRFYEGLAPRETAARLGVPVNTVRTRTRRGLELLRADLEHDRRAWFLGLLPLLQPRRAALGAILMKAKLAAVAAILVLSAAVVWHDDEGRFRIPVRSGKYELRVNLAGMAFRKVRGIESGREDILLRFAPGQEITGRIGSPDGYAPGSGSVEVWSDDVHGYAELDRSGGFSIRGLPAGTYELRAVGAAGGGGPAMRGEARAEAGAAGVRIELKKIDLR